MRNRLGTRIRAWLLLLFLGAGVLSPKNISGATEDIESQVKAAYLLNFARYVYWPHATAQDPAPPVVIGVYGRDSVTEMLERAVAGKNISGRPIRVRPFSGNDSVEKCDILYIPRSETRREPALLASLAGKPTLTVGDRGGFANDGGIVEFRIVDDSLRFAINLEAAEKANLKISSELLRVACAVIGRHK